MAIEQDREVLEALQENLLCLRHRVNTIQATERILGDHIYDLLGDELGQFSGETLCKAWDNHEGRMMRYSQLEQYLSFHERRAGKWLKRLQKGSSETTTK